MRRAIAISRPSANYIEDYHIFQTTKEEGVMRAIRNGLHGAGIPVENSKGEAAPGQEEINVNYAEALDMADRHVIIKNGCKEIAHGLGKAITFMAKWNYALAGSSSPHPPVAVERRRQDAAVPRQGGRARHVGADAALHGGPASAHAGEITYFLAPYINSYKRFIAGTFAPTKAVWCFDNRTAGFRLCGDDTKAIRVECRIGGADLNPYLAFAALLAAGLDGIEKKMELEPAFSGDAYDTSKKLREIPKTLREATALLMDRRCCAPPSATRSSTTMCIPPSGSSSSMTAASWIWTCCAASSSTEERHDRNDQVHLARRRQGLCQPAGRQPQGHRSHRRCRLRRRRPSGGRCR